MAKVGKIKYEIKSEYGEIPINCNSAGEFSCKMPVEIARSLNLPQEIKATTMAEINAVFHNALDRYKKAETKQELLIYIQYMASGHYIGKENEKDGLLFNSNSDYYMRMAFAQVDALAFSFDVIIRETVDKVETLYYAKKGKDIIEERGHLEGGGDNDLETYFKYGEYYCNNTGKLIAYSDSALERLIIVRERIRKASEVLFNFIDQPESLIIEQLNKGLIALT